MKRFSWCKIHHCVDRWIEQRWLRSKLDKIGFKVKRNQLQSELGFRLRSGIISITNRFLTSPPFSFVHFSDSRTTTRIIIISRIFYFSNETRIIPREIWHVSFPLNYYPKSRKLHWFHDETHLLPLFLQSTSRRSFLRTA